MNTNHSASTCQNHHVSRLHDQIKKASSKKLSSVSFTHFFYKTCFSLKKKLQKQPNTKNSAVSYTSPPPLRFFSPRPGPSCRRIPPGRSRRHPAVGSPPRLDPPGCGGRQGDSSARVHPCHPEITNLVTNVHFQKETHYILYILC